MPRNFFRRIEVAFPIEDGVLRERIINEILAVCLADNTKARFQRADGTYRRVRPAAGQPVRRSQVEFIARASGQTPHGVRAADGQPKYPRVRLAPSPFSGTAPAPVREGRGP